MQQTEIVVIPVSKLEVLIIDAVNACLDARQYRESDTSLTNMKPATIRELCEYLNVTEPTVLRWRKKGKIPFFTIGSAVRFNLNDVLKALEK